MTHYDITIINGSQEAANLAHKLQNRCKVLLIGEDTSIRTRYRNHIKTNNGYIVVLYKGKKNIKIYTEVLLDMDKAV